MTSTNRVLHIITDLGQGGAEAVLYRLIGATSDYLFPIQYRITREGVSADSLTGRMRLRWKEARRGLPERDGILLTPLPTASRLDAFRGILLRFAPPGEPGDRESVLAAIAMYAQEFKFAAVERG